MNAIRLTAWESRLAWINQNPPVDVYEQDLTPSGKMRFGTQDVLLTFLRKRLYVVVEGVE